MPYPIEQKLVVAVSSTALFDLREANAVFRTEGLDAFLEYQEENRANPPSPGAAFPFIQRLLGLNQVYADEEPIEVVILSRNHPKASLRVMDAVEHYGLNISRASFTAGDPPYPYMAATKAVLYLSTDRDEVREASRAAILPGMSCPARSYPTMMTGSYVLPSTLTASSWTMRLSGSTQKGTCRYSIIMKKKNVRSP